MKLKPISGDEFDQCATIFLAVNLIGKLPLDQQMSSEKVGKILQTYGLMDSAKQLNKVNVLRSVRLSSPTVAAVMRKLEEWRKAIVLSMEDGQTLPITVEAILPWPRDVARDLYMIRIFDARDRSAFSVLSAVALMASDMVEVQTKLTIMSKNIEE